MYWLASRRARVLRACRRLQCRHHPAQVHPVLRHRQQRDLLVVSLLPILRLLVLLLPLLRHRVLEPRVAPLHRVLRAGAARLLPLARHLGRETRVQPVQAAFRPEVVVPKAGGGREYWMVEGRTFAKNSNIGLDTPDEAREMSDIDARVAHMDELGVDTHVLYPTIFLRPLTRRQDAEVALCKGYNRWLADIWKKGRGRLRWVVVPPVMSMDKAIEELPVSYTHLTLPTKA